MLPHSMPEQGVTGILAASPDLTREKPLPTNPPDRSTVRRVRCCPRCGKLNSGTNLSCDGCGTELPADTPAPAQGEAANIATPSFGGYAKNSLTGATMEGNLTSKATASGLTSKTDRATGGVRRKSGLPVLGILVIVLPLAGAGIAVWMLRSSLRKWAAAPLPVVVTISPASAQVVVGKAFDFSATVSGTNDTQVSWSVQEGDAGGRVVSRGDKAEGGTRSSMATYIAPRTPGTYHLLATSKADPRKSASAEATVTNTDRLSDGGNATSTP